MGLAAILPESRSRARRRAAIAAPLASSFLLLVSIGCRDAPPNVLLVSIDTLRADHLAAYGYERETSPALTELARTGARFENSYSQSSSTVPTHASLFTGRYGFQHGSYHVGLPVREEEVTLAERLRDRGYRTFGIASSIRFEGATGFDQGFDHFESLAALDKNDRSEAVTTRALEWIHGSDGRPWFAFVHFFDPHEPYAPPEPFRSLFGERVPRPVPEKTSEYLYLHDGPDKPVPPRVLSHLRGLYDGEIRFLDTQLARLFEGIAGERDTLVIVTSDHGEEFKEHGGLSHSRRLHEELLRVPLLIRWPGRISPGTVIRAPVQTIDLLPTILALVGVGPDPDLPGTSHAARLLGRERDRAAGDARGIVLTETKSSWAVAATLAGRRLKYYARGDGPAELYDLDADPGGHVDVSAGSRSESAALVEIAMRLGLGAARGTARPVEPVPPEVRARLREIGYVDEVDDLGAGVGD